MEVMMCWTWMGEIITVYRHLVSKTVGKRPHETG